MTTAAKPFQIAFTPVARRLSLNALTTVLVTAVFVVKAEDLRVRAEAEGRSINAPSALATARPLDQRGLTVQDPYFTEQP